MLSRHMISCNGKHEWHSAAPGVKQVF
jgi:hypothetical protein